MAVNAPMVGSNSEAPIENISGNLAFARKV